MHTNFDEFRFRPYGIGRPDSTCMQRRVSINASDPA